MLPRVFPEGTSEGGRDPLAGGTRTGCSITARTSHVPAGLAAHVISRQRDVWLCGATIFRRWVSTSNARLTESQ